MNKNIELSIVVPVYGCVSCLEHLVERIEKQMLEMRKSYEIVLVDDRSPDLSWQTIDFLTKTNENVIGVRLSRNFGQQIAIVAGLQHSRGEYVVVMDCDLQDPPELIPQLYEEVNKGYDLVFAKRISRNHGFFRVALAAV